MKVKLYFVVINIIALATLFGFVVYGQISNIQLQTSTINVREQQLKSLELNYQMQEENLKILAELGTEGLISRTGEVLTDVLTLLHSHNLTLLDLNAGEYASHYEAIETRAAITCKGYAHDIIAFLYDLSQHSSNIQIWRTQVYQEDAEQQLQLTFSVFEERRR